MQTLLKETARGLSPRQFYARGGEMKIGLVPDDVLLVTRAAPEPGLEEEWGPGFVRVVPDEAFNDPGFADRDLSSRSNVDTTVFLDKKRTIRLRRPFVSSPMLDVTGAKLAIALGKVGGAGIIHRAQSTHEEAREVSEVKNAMGYIFEHPPTLPLTATVFDAREKMNQSQRGLVVITDGDNRVLRVVTRRNVKRDIVPQDLPLSQLPTIKKGRKVITVTSDIDTSDPFSIYVRTRDKGRKVLATTLMWKNDIEKLVVVDSENRLIGAITDYDLREIRENPNASVDNKGRLVVGAAIGIGGNYLQRAEELVAAGADFLCIDVANAYLKTVRFAMYQLKKRFPNIVLMVGSNATRQGVRILKDSRDGTRVLVDEGADVIRNHIGSGSICITRGVSGFGYPSITSTFEVADEADKYGIPVVADGGIRYSSDVAKFIAAGATAVMLGRLFAATEEGNGDLIIDDDTKVRMRSYRGMASEDVRRRLDEAEGRQVTAFSKKPEGVPRKVVIIGSVADVVRDLTLGLQSGATYGGVANLDQFRNEIDFIRGTASTQAENNVQVFP